MVIAQPLGNPLLAYLCYASMRELILQWFQVSSPDCALHTARNHVITVLEGVDSHVPYVNAFPVL